MDKQTQISCLVLDDQLFATNILKAHIKLLPQLSLQLSTTDVDLALSVVNESKIDLVFLDIQMPKMSGLDFLKRCKNKCRFIFTTAYSDYAIAGYEHDIVDFLLKPISFERFKRAVEKFEAISKSEQLTARADRQMMVIKGDAKQNFYKIDLDDILFIKGLSNYIAIHRSSGSPIITYMNLKEIIGELPVDRFCQVHRSYIVSLAHIDSLTRNNITIGTAIIPISTSRKTAFFKLWEEWHR